VADLLVVATDATSVEAPFVFAGPVAGELTEADALVLPVGDELWSPGDIDGDGVGDLVSTRDATGEGGGGVEATLLFGPLDAPREVGPVRIGAVGTSTRMSACDLDGDGVPELLVPGGAHSALVLDQTLTSLVTLDAPGKPAQGGLLECLGDIDGDGADEVMVGQSLYLDPLAGTGVATGTGPEGLVVPWRADDLDGDGAADVLLPSGAAVTLLRGPLTGLSGVGVPLQGLDDDWENARQVIAGGDTDGDGVGDLLLGLSPTSPTSESGDPPGGRLALFRGPLPGALDVAKAVVVLEGELIKLACHDEETLRGTRRECDERAEGEAGEHQGDLPGLGFVGDQDGDGGDDLFLVTRTDYAEQGLWVLAGGSW
jgi:hypothetical protein